MTAMPNIRMRFTLSDNQGRSKGKDSSFALVIEFVDGEDSKFTLTSVPAPSYDSTIYLERSAAIAIINGCDVNVVVSVSGDLTYHKVTIWQSSSRVVNSLQGSFACIYSSRMTI
jgi:hypothetical protein